MVDSKKSHNVACKSNFRLGYTQERDASASSLLLTTTVMFKNQWVWLLCVLEREKDDFQPKCRQVRKPEISSLTNPDQCNSHRLWSKFKVATPKTNQREGLSTAWLRGSSCEFCPQTHFTSRLSVDLGRYRSRWVVPRRPCRKSLRHRYSQCILFKERNIHPLFTAHSQSFWTHWADAERTRALIWGLLGS